MSSRALGAFLALAAVVPAWAGDPESRESPRLALRATPRFALRAPVQVLVTAELVGGHEAEEYYCPALEWEWGDGSRSVHEADCPPLEEGGVFERRFSEEHVFRGPGRFNVRLTLLRTNRPVAAASASVTVY